MSEERVILTSTPITFGDVIKTAGLIETLQGLQQTSKMVTRRMLGRIYYWVYDARGGVLIHDESEVDVFDVGNGSRVLRARGFHDSGPGALVEQVEVAFRAYVTEDAIDVLLLNAGRDGA